MRAYFPCPCGRNVEDDVYAFRPLRTVVNNNAVDRGYPADRGYPLEWILLTHSCGASVAIRPAMKSFVHDNAASGCRTVYWTPNAFNMLKQHLMAGEDPVAFVTLPGKNNT